MVLKFILRLQKP